MLCVRCNESFILGRTEVHPKDYERALIPDLTFFQLQLLLRKIGFSGVLRIMLP